MLTYATAAYYISSSINNHGYYIADLAKLNCQYYYF